MKVHGTYIGRDKPLNVKNNGKSIYNNIVDKKNRIAIYLVFMIIATFIINIFVGSAGLSLIEVISAILRRDGSTNILIVWQFRIPMALSAIFIGILLGIGGCEMQTILGNPMASPYTLGISSAASFGAALAIILDFSLISKFGNLMISLNAFIFSIIGSSIIFAFSKKYEADKNIIVLFGIALNFLFGSMTTFLQYIANENDLQSLMFWSFGDLNKINWSELLIIFVAMVIGIIIFSRNIWKLTAMSMGDISAISLGVDVNKLRRNTFITVAFLSAISVSFAGTIGFVGLVAPHIARLMCGEDQRYLLPISALTGGLMLSVSSILSKSLIPGTILPIGLVTSLIGIPFFIYLIVEKRGSYI